MSLSRKPDILLMYVAALGFGVALRAFSCLRLPVDVAVGTGLLASPACKQTHLSIEGASDQVPILVPHDRH